ncbi:MAG: hypothetical protein IPO88_11380 [Nannocystis sp.]|uniref:hypothetical protein n=1 Tax=Nannocystis sp. TaxID=1962667 RepID=UPI0024293269|nr:hypothetical protein [Nannocystis sp.]MBK9754088.1 hypothetical protein [Nannocystis sp.]
MVVLESPSVAVEVGVEVEVDVDVEPEVEPDVEPDVSAWMGASPGQPVKISASADAKWPKWS